jgi:2-polyprenyl-6-methoxyphenol hydroxylase-like FAD-dependent oxidoreductase
MRSELTEILLTKQYGYELANIQFEEDGVNAIFTTGELVTGSVVIGSDGPRSRIRKVILVWPLRTEMPRRQNLCEVPILCLVLPSNPDYCHSYQVGHFLRINE